MVINKAEQSVMQLTPYQEDKALEGPIRSGWAAQGRWPGPEDSVQGQRAQTKQDIHKATHVKSLSAEAEPFPTGKTNTSHCRCSCSLILQMSASSEPIEDF